MRKLLEAPCGNHEGPVKHALKDCNLMKRLLAGTMKQRAPEAAKKVARGQDEDDETGYPREDGAVLMIFGGTPARPPKRQEKLI